MNKYQRLIIIVAAMNVLLMLLFPPFANQPLAKGMIPGLQGFYPVFMQFGKQPVFTELLTLELLFIAINTLIAWLLLNNQTRDGTLPNVGFTFGILCVAIANLLLIVLFPPYESSRGLIRGDSGFFEGFYFVFGFNYRRVVFTPLLYLECLLVAINAFAIYLLFSVMRNTHNLRERSIAELAAKLSPEELEQLASDLRQRKPEATLAEDVQIGRHGDRRKETLPPPGEDRRKGDRRDGHSAAHPH